MAPAGISVMFDRCSGLTVKLSQFTIFAMRDLRSAISRRRSGWCLENHDTAFLPNHLFPVSDTCHSLIFLLAEGEGRQYQNAGFDMTYAWGYHGFGDGVIRRIASDENSWHGTVFEQFGTAAEAFAVLTPLLKGMPLLYSGQETGLDKRLLFFDIDQIEWQKHPFTGIYTVLIQLKKENKSLWNGISGGEIKRVSTTHDDEIYAFSREKAGDELFVIINLSPDNVDVTLLDTLQNGQYKNVFTGDTVSLIHSITQPPSCMTWPKTGMLS
jgi:hypothetical protein